MPLKNVDKLKEAIRNDCQISGRYYEGDTGQTCAVGGIAEAAGIDMKEWVAQFWWANADILSLGKHEKLINAINNEFGLVTWQLREIQNINDRPEFREGGSNKIEERRAAILARIEEYIADEARQ